MRKSYSKRVFGVLFLVLVSLTGKLYSQSASLGNTYIFSGTEMSVINVQHNFVNGGSGVLPGIVGTDRIAPNGFLSFSGTASWTGASATSYVDGYVKTYETGNFIFPIGDNGIYRPVAVSASSPTAPLSAAYYGVSGSTAITSSLKGGNESVLPSGGPFATSNMGTGVISVDSNEYWDINGTTSAKITLSWGSESSIATLTNSDLSKLIIVGWNGTQWEAIPSIVDTTSLLGGTSGLEAGSITTNSALVPDSYSVYTLAEACIATTPLLTMNNPICNGTTSYDVDFSTNGVVSASAGTIVGTKIVGIPVGTNVTVTATSTSGCGATQTMTIVSPANCNPTDLCLDKPSLSVSNGICNSTGGYSVAFDSNGTVTASAGTISGNTILGIASGTNVVVTTTNGTCTNMITVVAPTDCNPSNPCSSSKASFAAGTCNGGTYSVQVNNPSGLVITASTGTVTATAITGIIVGTNVTITATPTDVSCSAQVITITSPSCLLPAIIAVVDTPVIAPGASSPSVLNNDTLNGVPVTLATVNLTHGILPTGITMNPNGTITAATGTPAGSYLVVYTICEKANPNNCSTITDTVTIIAIPSIAIIKTGVVNDLNSDGYQEIGETITYSFAITNTGNVPLTNVTVTDPLPGIVMTGTPISLATGETNSTAYTGVYTLTKEDIVRGSVTNQATVYGTSNGVVVTALSRNSNNILEGGTVLPIVGCAIEVFNAVSPNGDGDNDVFYIRGLECYPDNTVEIYNRWGVLVFERTSYNNSDRAFKGVSEGRVTINKSEELPVGTYFYIFKYKDTDSNTHEKAGYLYLNR